MLGFSTIIKLLNLLVEVGSVLLASEVVVLVAVVVLNVKYIVVCGPVVRQCPRK
jgi:hypothetical protein